MMFSSSGLRSVQPTQMVRHPSGFASRGSCRLHGPLSGGGQLPPLRPPLLRLRLRERPLRGGKLPPQLRLRGVRLRRARRLLSTSRSRRRPPRRLPRRGGLPPRSPPRSPRSPPLSPRSRRRPPRGREPSTSPPTRELLRARLGRPFRRRGGALGCGLPDTAGADRERTCRLQERRRRLRRAGGSGLDLDTDRKAAMALAPRVP
mmetsp:Transcript_37382/g.98597  ORF Transcript_37382/g.98597 Transcript_37382/m.98597 type:complete len:204 (-) Transcript_37382:3-614(-)